MKSLSNVGAERLGDALGESIDDGAKLSIISSYFTVFAYGELKEELSKVDEVRFLFSEPTFIKRMADSKEPREFEVARRAREVGGGGSGLELTLRNNLNQRALARECAEWIREKGVFKSAKTSGAIQPGGTYVVENPSGDDHAFMGAAANFTQEGLGYERRPGTVTCVSHFENATEAVGLKMMFESVWDNPAMVEEVTAQVAAQVELDNDGYLRSKPFQDLGMQSDVVAYLDLLKASQKTLKDANLIAWWGKRTERAKMLKKFVNKYNLQVGAKYADDFNMLVTMGEHVKDDASKAADKLVSKARFEKVDCDGYYCYEAKVANTTKYTYYDIVRKYTAHTVMEPDANHDEKWVNNQEVSDFCASWYPGENIFLEAQYDSSQDPDGITVKLWDFQIGDPGK